MNKRCAKCKEIKPTSEFPVRRANRDGLYSYCRPCAVADARAWRLANHDSYKADQNRRWAESTPERMQKHRDACNQRMERIRQEIWDHYGRVCTCCGEDNQAFFTLDHIHNNGAAERKRLKADGASYHLGGVGFYARLKRDGFPPGYQTLCYNCNCAKGRFGVCPHQKQIKDLVESARVSIA